MRADPQTVLNLLKRLVPADWRLKVSLLDYECRLGALATLPNGARIQAIEHRDERGEREIAACFAIRIRAAADAMEAGLMPTDPLPLPDEPPLQEDEEGLPPRDTLVVVHGRLLRVPPVAA